MLRLDVCTGGLCIELVSIPIQEGNCNGHEYEFACLDAHELAHGIYVRFQYQIMFGCQTMELIATLVYASKTEVI